MYRPNEAHRQVDCFGLESQLAPALWARLEKTREYAFYGEVFCRIPEGAFAGLYAEQRAGRPNVPVNQLVGALVLQHVHDWTVEELLEHVALDLRTRVALGMRNLTEVAFCRATYFNFLRRLRDYMGRTGEHPLELVFEQLTTTAMARFGLSGSIQRCDSTQIGSNIRDYTRIELLISVVLRMWRALRPEDQAAHAERLAPYVGHKQASEFLMHLRQSEFEATLAELGARYAWMVETFEAGYRDQAIYHVVCRVFAEHFVRVEEQIRLRAPAETASDAIQSPDDLEATRRKREDAVHVGFVLHASETAHPENPLQLVTDVAVAPNNRDDSRILEERLPLMQERTPDLDELHTDGGYGSPANDAIQAAQGIAAVQTAIRGRTSQAPFEIQKSTGPAGATEQAGYSVRCAAGIEVPGQPTRRRHKAVFPAAACAGCALRARCPGRLRKDGGRTFYFDESDYLRGERHRRLASLPPERQTLRANVEATMKQFKAPCRHGKLRTRGLHAVARYAILRAIAINFGRIYRYKLRLRSLWRHARSILASSAAHWRDRLLQGNLRRLDTSAPQTYSTPRSTA